VQAHGRVDLIREFAFPLPALVICELLGVPASDRDMLRDWSGAAIPILDAVIQPDALGPAEAAVRSLADYFDALVPERRRRPKSDLLSTLIAAEDAGDKLSHDELISTLIFVFGAGH